MKFTPDIHLIKCLQHVCFQVQRLKGQGRTGFWKFYCVRSMTVLIWPINIASISRSRGHCQMGRLKFLLSAPWLCAYLTNSLHIWHEYDNPWGDDVSYSISRSKVQRSRSLRLLKNFAHFLCGDDVTHHFQVKRSTVKVTHRSFKVFAVPAPCLFDGLASYKYNPWGKNWPLFLYEKWQVHFIRCTDMTEVAVCCAPFLGKK